MYSVAVRVARRTNTFIFLLSIILGPILLASTSAICLMQHGKFRRRLSENVGTRRNDNCSPSFEDKVEGYETRKREANKPPSYSSTLPMQPQSVSNEDNAKDKPLDIWSTRGSCILENGSYYQWDLSDERKNCKVYLIASSPEKVESLLKQQFLLSEQSPPTILLFKRSRTCDPFIGTLSLLMHPRIYWVITDTLCFGDSYQSTSVLPSTNQERLSLMADVRTQVLTHSSIFLPSTPALWTSWQMHLHMTSKSSQETEITVDLNSQYKQILVPKFQKNWTSTNDHCKPCNATLRIPKLPWKVLIMKSCFRYWLFEAMQTTIKAGNSSTLFQFAKSWDESNVVFTCEKKIAVMRPFLRARTVRKFFVVLSKDMKKNNGVCGTLNVNTWSTSDCMISSTGIPIALPPKYLLSSGTLQLPPTSNSTRRRYLASFMGTHYKDRFDGSYGIIRHLLRQFNDESSNFIVYTRCHTAHKSQCEGSEEGERLFHFSKQPRYKYNDLLQESLYCLAPKGRQPASYRFLESILFGCIPVYISDPGDNYMYTFVEARHIPWEKVSFYIHGFSVSYIKKFLQDVPLEEKEARQHATLLVANTFFSSLELIARNFLLEVQAKLMTHISP